MSNKISIVVFILVIIWIIIGFTSGVYPNNGQYTLDDPANFWSGVWHGMWAGVNFIRSLFNSEVGIYEINNNGGWYNFGYILSVGAIFRNRAKYKSGEH